MNPTLKSLAVNVGIEIERKGETIPPGWNQRAHAYKVTLTYRRRKLSTPYYQGLGVKEDPTAESVLESLVMDAEGIDSARTFEEWALDIGWDPDSRKAEATYNACKVSAAKLKTFLGRDFKTFMGAER